MYKYEAVKSAKRTYICRLIFLLNQKLVGSMYLSTCAHSSTAMHVSEIFGILKGHLTTGQSETITSVRKVQRETGVRVKLERMFTVVHNKLLLVKI